MTTYGNHRVAQDRLGLYQVIGSIAGGALGFAVASAIYLTINPMLERSSGWLRETQGLLWNLVPLLTILGLFAGWRLTVRCLRNR